MNEDRCHCGGELSETKISLASIPLDRRRRYIDDVCRVLNESRFGLGRTWHCLVDLSGGHNVAFQPANRFSILECTQMEIWPLDIQRLMSERRHPACTCVHAKIQGLMSERRHPACTCSHATFQGLTGHLTYLPNAPPAHERTFNSGVSLFPPSGPILDI